MTIYDPDYGCGERNIILTFGVGQFHDPMADWHADKGGAVNIP